MLGVEAHTLHSLALPALQVEWENVELRGQLLGVTQERDSALLKSRGLQSKLESLEQVLKVRGLCGGGGGLGPWHREKVGQWHSVGHWGVDRVLVPLALPFSSLSFLFDRECLEHTVSEAPSSSIYRNSRAGLGP